MERSDVTYKGLANPGQNNVGTLSAPEGMSMGRISKLLENTLKYGKIAITVVNEN